MKNLRVFGFGLLCLSSMVLSSCKEHITDSIFPQEIKSIDYFVHQGLTPQPLPNQLLITKDSIVFHWSKSFTTSELPKEKVMEKRVVFHDTTLFQSIVSRFSVNEVWNYQDVYGNNDDTPDKVQKRLTFAGDDKKTKSIYVWDGAEIPQKLSSYTKILDSLVNTYKIQHPIP